MEIQLVQNINIMMKMKYIKSYKIFENTSSLVKKFGDIIYKINKDIEFIKDKCLELEDMGYYVSVNYTPITLAKAEHNIDSSLKIPEFYLDIQKDKSMNSFYGDLGERRDIVDSVIFEILEYMSENGYKILHRENKISEITTTDPKDFQFINNPTSYQVLFTIDDES